MRRLLSLLALLSTCAQRPLPAQLRTTTNVAYGPDTAQRLDLYRPATCPATGCKVVAWYHGHNGPRALSYQLRLPTYRGIAVASCGYRVDSLGVADLTTLQDAKACRAWLTEHAAFWTLDTTRVACWGASLGGYLCNWLATTCGDTLSGRGTSDECVRGGVAQFGASDLTTQAAELAALGCPGQSLMRDSVEAARASPIRYVRATSAAWMGVHGRKDCTVPVTQSIRLDSAYRAVGATSRMRLYDLGHGGAAWTADSILKPQLNFLSAVLR